MSRTFRLRRRKWGYLMNTKNLILKLIIGILVIAGIYLIARPLLNMMGYKRSLNIDTSLQEMITHDKEVLNNLKPESTTDEEMAMAASLRRLSFSSREDILPLIEKYQNHPSLIVREAAIEAAGALNDQALTQFLASRLESSEPRERIAALKALTRHQSQDHQFIIQSYMAKTKMGPTETVWAKLALSRVSQDPKIRNRYLEELLSDINIQEIGDTGERASALKEITRQVLGVFQGDQSVIKFAQMLLQNGKDDETALHALQYSVAYSKDWLKENLASLPMRTLPNFQINIMDFIKKECPSGASSIVEKLETHNRTEYNCP